MGKRKKKHHKSYKEIWERRVEIEHKCSAPLTKTAKRKMLRNKKRGAHACFEKAIKNRSKNRLNATTFRYHKQWRL